MSIFSIIAYGIIGGIALAIGVGVIITLIRIIIASIKKDDDTLSTIIPHYFS